MLPSMISAPDTADARRLAALHQAQASRRVSTQHILFLGITPTDGAEEVISCQHSSELTTELAELGAQATIYMPALEVLSRLGQVQYFSNT